MNFSKSLKNPLLVIFSALFLLNVGSSRGSTDSEHRYEVSLYTGIHEIGHLGESYKSLTEGTKIPFTPIDITEDEALLKAGIVYGISFDSIGAKIYFKRSGSSLITLQPPFRGSIKSQQIQIFDTEKPANVKWEEFILKGLGQPQAQGTGGFLGGDIFYYNWGDIEASRVGLRQLSLYRDKSIVEYRQNGKPNPVKLFK
jgi:hypothetical protein